MDTFAEVVAWTEHLTAHSTLAPATIRRYSRDAEAFVRWLFQNTLDHRLSEVTAGDARDYRDALLAAGHKPATINRVRLSLAVLLDAHGTTPTTRSVGCARSRKFGAHPRRCGVPNGMLCAVPPNTKPSAITGCRSRCVLDALCRLARRRSRCPATAGY